MPAWKYEVHTIPWPSDAGAPFENLPIVIVVLHPMGGVGPVGSVEPPQPDSAVASATPASIRVSIGNPALCNPGRQLGPVQCILQEDTTQRRLAALTERRARFTATAQQHIAREQQWWLENRDCKDIFATGLEDAVAMRVGLPGAGTRYPHSVIPNLAYLQKINCHLYYTYDDRA